MNYVTLKNIIAEQKDIFHKFEQLAELTEKELNEEAKHGDEWGLAAQAYIFNFKNLKSAKEEQKDAQDQLGVSAGFTISEDVFDSYKGRYAVLRVVLGA